MLWMVHFCFLVLPACCVPFFMPWMTKQCQQKTTAICALTRTSPILFLSLSPYSFQKRHLFKCFEDINASIRYVCLCAFDIIHRRSQKCHIGLPPYQSGEHQTAEQHAPGALELLKIHIATKIWSVNWTPLQKKQKAIKQKGTERIQTHANVFTVHAFLPTL